jgi:Tfp pilus assembly protein PilO
MRILFPALLVIAAIAIFFGYTNPHYSAIRSKKAEADKIEVAKTNAYNLNKKRDELIDKRNSLAPFDRDKILKMLPDGVENVGLIIEINNIAKRNNMGEIMNPQVNSTGGAGKTGAKGLDSTKYSSISMSFGVSGTYDEFLNFLKDLETYVRIVDVTSLSFAPTVSKDGKDGKYDYSLTIQTYWLK